MIEGLKKLGLYDNAMIVITSDHGEEFYEHGMWMHGGHLYNELIHVPLVIKYPGSKRKGRRVSRNVSLTDIAPTILEELGIEYPEEEFDGRDLLLFLQDENEPERYCFAEIPVKGNLGKISVVYRDFKLIWNRIVHEDRFKAQAPPVEVELYKLSEDPGEKNNLAAEEAELVEYLMAKIQEYLRKEPKAKQGDKERPVIDEELQKRLRALGYIQ